MIQFFSVTFKGILRDRVFQGILITALLFIVIPGISTLSMRQVPELSITLSLSLISFILLLISVFLGATSVWKDIELRYTFSVLGFPIGRRDYILGKFAAIAVFILLITLVLGFIALTVIWFVSLNYPPARPIAWINIFFALFFDAIKYIFLAGFAFLLSSVSTSFFLPVFGTISIFLVGGITQQVYDFVSSASADSFSPFIRLTVKFLYYILPNFEAFDLKLNAIYGISISYSGLAITFVYFIAYLAVLLAFSVLIFSNREL